MGLFGKSKDDKIKKIFDTHGGWSRDCSAKNFSQVGIDAFNNASQLDHIVELQKKYLEDANFCLDEAIRLNVEPYALRSTCWNIKARIFNYFGKYKKCISYCDEAIKLNPDDTDSLVLKGIAMVCLEKNFDSLSCFDEAIKLNPEDAKAWFWKGSAYYNLDDMEQSQACRNKAKKLGYE
jgi:tetratricopeptide (TPR) repeat protein